MEFDLQKYGWHYSPERGVHRTEPMVHNPNVSSGGHGSRRMQKELDNYRLRVGLIDQAEYDRRKAMEGDDV